MRGGFWLLILLGFAAPAQAASVLVTIKPVHSLVASVMQGAGVPDLLITGAQSEHNFALRPSDARKIEGAQVIFEIGPDLETYLVEPLATLGRHADIVRLEHASGVHLLPARRGGLWDDGSDPDDGPIDPHLWLDPENAIAMTKAIAAALVKDDPEHAALYHANATRAVANLQSLELEVDRTLKPARGRSYFVFHDAYHYFEKRFGLTPSGTVTVAPDRPVGPRRVESLRSAILRRDIVCVFREPQFSPHLVETLAEGSRVRIGVLDPLGAELTPGPGLYPALLQNLAQSLSACLKNR